jgi:hypothetical protein
MFLHRKETTAPPNLGALDAWFGQFFLEQFGGAAENCPSHRRIAFGLAVRDPERDGLAPGSSSRSGDLLDHVIQACGDGAGLNHAFKQRVE